MSFLGADTDELREAGQKCQEGAETTDEVITYLRALVIALRAASFFTGGASAAYAQYLESTVIPWLQRISAALKLFANVLLSNAQAQDDVSAGESVDFGTLPTYVTPKLPSTDTCNYPPVVANTGGVAPATRVESGTTGAAVTTTTSATTGGVAQISPAATPGLGGFGADNGSTNGHGPGTVSGSVGNAGGAPAPYAGHDSIAPRTGGLPAPATAIGTDVVSGADAGTNSGTGTTSYGGGTPGAVPTTGTSTTGTATTDTGTSTSGTTGATGDPTSRTFGSPNGVDGDPTSSISPLVTEQAGIGTGGNLGTAAGIAAGAGALGLGAAAAARRTGATTDSEIEDLVASNGRGSRGEDVRALQEKLTAAGYDTQGVDGQWGRNTQAAYQAWRADHPLEIRLGTGYTSPDGFDYESVVGVRGNPHVTPEFLREMEGVAQRVGARPEDLMAVMALESARTFSPDVQNPDTRATGLIQFMPETARGLGTSTEALTGMTAREQLPYVERYLESRRGHIGNLESLYTSILYGSPQEDPNTTLWNRGQAAYGANHGLDRNGDGRITAGEAADSVRTFIKK